MAFTFAFDFDGHEVTAWSRTADGVEDDVDDDYRPTVYAAADDPALADLAEALEYDPRVVDLGYERWHLDLEAQSKDRPKTRVLRIDVAEVGRVRPLAHDVISGHERGDYEPGTYRLYNVDLPPEFRYCVETDTSPEPDEELELRTLRLGIGEKRLADGDVSRLSVDGETVAGDEATVLETVAGTVERVDPDVLVVDPAGLVPLLYERAADRGYGAFGLGRGPGYDRLAAENTVASYGRVLHSPARFDVPGRVILDASSSFLWNRSGLAGMLDLVELSWRPLQETGWASIGTVLTSMQIKEALERDILVPWNKWDAERFKDVDTLHAADRGGFTFDPDVGVHEGVVEVDFSSLYPYIIYEHNISPETVGCSCHPERTTIPELDYNVCERDGFLPAVLKPVLDHREDLKRRIREADDEAARAEFESRSEALKWILVTCFGYQGYRNAKWGRIECHEAINAVARDVLLTSKRILEEAGWRIVHGIVDSLWITPLDDRDPVPVDELCERVTDEIGIRLEYEADYEWIAFVPKRDSAAGALNRYFGKVADEDAFKVRGIEARQRSTPPWIGAAQRELLAEFDRHRTPEAVCDRLARFLGELRRGAVDPGRLVVTRRVSKRPEDYDRESLAVDALRRSTDLGVELSPGQSVRYVVVDEGGRGQGRVRLQFEDPDRYDADHYADRLLRACESVLSPLGWDRRRIERRVDGVRDVRLSAFE